MELYLVITSFCEYLIQFVDSKKFNASTYNKMKNTKNYGPTHDNLVNKFQLDMDYTNFYSSITKLFKKFKSEILDTDPEFYKRPNIDLVFKFLHFLLKSDIFVITYSIQNNKKSVYLDQDSTTELISIYNSMLSVFKSNNSERLSSILALTENGENDENEVVSSVSSISQSTSIPQSSNDRLTFIESNLVQISESLKLLMNLTVNRISSQTLINDTTKEDNSSKSSQTNNNSTSKNETKMDEDFGVMRTQIKNLLNKKQWKEHHVSSFNSFLKAKKVPPSVFYRRFPDPFLHDDALFINEYNDMINDFQQKYMNLCLNHLNRQIESIDDSINKMKSELRPLYSDIDLKVNSINYEITELNKEKFIQRDDKIKRILKYDGPTKFTVKEYKNSFKDNSFLNNYNNFKEDINKAKKQYRNRTSSTTEKLNNSMKSSVSLNNSQSYSSKNLNTNNTNNNNNIRRRNYQKTNDNINNKNINTSANKNSSILSNNTYRNNNHNSSVSKNNQMNNNQKRSKNGSNRRNVSFENTTKRSNHSNFNGK